MRRGLLCTPEPDRGKLQYRGAPQGAGDPAQKRPHWLRIGWRAIRPHTLPLSAAPVLAGSVVGWAQSGALRLDITLAAALSAACMQIGANLQNDAADTLNGTDAADRPGPVRLTQQGWVSAAGMLRAAWLAFALAVACGVYLVAIGGLPLVIVGLLAVAAAAAYSGGPRPISRGPFGEVVVLIFFGLVAVAGVAWLYSGVLSLPSLLMGLAVGLPAAAVLMINNLRDNVSDARAGRRTLVIALGPAAATRTIAALLLTTVPALLALAVLGRPWSGAMLGLLALSMAVPLMRSVRRVRRPQEYNRLLKMTVGFQLLLTVLAGLGITVSQLMFPSLGIN